MGNRITFFYKKICLTRVPISIELNQCKSVWKSKKIKPLVTAIANLFFSYIQLKHSFHNGGKLRNRITLFILGFTVVLITIFVFFSRTSTNESAGFSVPSQRVNTGKSAAITQKWNGVGKIADMIWE